MTIPSKNTMSRNSSHHQCMESKLLNKISDPFELIQEGNIFESSSNRWGAADSYSRASIALRRRADHLSTHLRSAMANGAQNRDIKGGDTNKMDEEKRKVVSLYRGQSLEYFYKARHCLLQALTHENEQDRERMLAVAKSGVGSLDPFCSSLAQEDSERRQRTFAILFSRGDDGLESQTKINGAAHNDVSSAKDEECRHQYPARPVPNPNSLVETERSVGKKFNINESKPATDSKPPNTQSSPPEEEMDWRRQSVESRLANLNSSLLTTNIPRAPPLFIPGSRASESSDQNRMEDIQRTLGRLGVALPEHTNNHHINDITTENLSQEDQIKLIIQQAQDETRLANGMHLGRKGGGSDFRILAQEDDGIIDENDSMFEGFEDEEEDIDALLVKAERIVTQSKLELRDEEGGSLKGDLVQIKKAQALLLEARLYLEVEQPSTSANHESNNNDCEEKTIAEFSSVTVNDNSDKDELEAKGSVNAEPNEKNQLELIARKKARERLQNAESCLKILLENWEVQTIVE